MRTTFNMLVAGVVLFGGISAARAADPLPVGGLTESALKYMLDDEGYEVISKTNADGGKYFVISFTKNKLDFKVTMSISPSRSKVWLSTAFVGVPTADKLSKDQLMKMLETNSKAATFFVVGEDTKSVFLNRCFDNRSLTSKTLRAELDRYISDVTDFWPVVRELRPIGVANNR